MKLIRTVRPHEAIDFGPDDDADLNDTIPDDIVRVDSEGVKVSEKDAARYAKRAEVLGVEVEVLDVADAEAEDKAEAAAAEKARVEAEEKATADAQASAAAQGQGPRVGGSPAATQPAGKPAGSNEQKG